MNLVFLSEDDLAQVDTLFSQFHAEYTCFFQTKTRSVAKPAIDYLHGMLFTKQPQNMTEFCREVADSDYEAMQHFISNSPWDQAELKKQFQTDVIHLLADPIDGALILDQRAIPKQGKMSVGVGGQYCGRLGPVLWLLG